MLTKIIFTTQNTLRWIILKLILIYQKGISPFLGNHCRFYPSCSQYAHDAFMQYSVPKALYLTVRRLLRCHPFCKGGVDFISHIDTETETDTMRQPHGF